MGRDRNKQVRVRLKENELEKLKRKVESSGLSQQDYLLACILEKPILNSDGIKAVVPELEQTRHQLVAIGSNLNQVAKALNGRGYYDYRLITENQQELKETMKGLRELWQQLKSSIPRET